MKKRITLLLIVVFTNVFAQTDVEKLRNDIVKYTYDYVHPAADLSVNIAQVTWANDATINAFGKAQLSIFGTYSFIGGANRKTLLKSSDLEILSIDGGQESVYVPTIFGKSSDIKLIGDVDLLSNGNLVSIAFEAPDGVDKNTIRSYALQGAVGLGYNTELLLRYIPKTKIDEVINKGYGIGFKHNFTYLFDSLKKNNIDLAFVVAYTKFNISNEITFTVGADEITRAEADGNTMNYQVLVSKNMNKITLNSGLSYLRNSYNISFEGTDGILLQILNDGLASNTKLATTYKLDLGATYHYKKFDFYTNFSYSSFSNITLGINYNLSFK